MSVKFLIGTRTIMLIYLSSSATSHLSVLALHIHTQQKKCYVIQDWASYLMFSYYRRQRCDPGEFLLYVLVNQGARPMLCNRLS